MDRRTFVLLTGATSGALIRPPVRPTHSPTGAGWRSGGPAVGRLRFELDDHRRWSLWYYGDGSPVPVVRGAEIVAWVGDQPLTLAELEDSTVGNRRPPGGDAVVVRGRAAGVWVEAELLTAGGSAPKATPPTCACASTPRATAWRRCARCSCHPRPSTRSASHRPWRPRGGARGPSGRAPSPKRT